jgi:hypothetical protein
VAGDTDVTMNDTERRFHEAWLGMVQPSEGLVVSVPVLVENQCMAKQPHEVQEALLGCVAEAEVASKGEGHVAITDVSQFLSRVLALSDSVFDSGDQLPKPLRLYVPEGRQELRPTRALRRRKDAPAQSFQGADLPAAAVAGRDYLALLWEVPIEVDLDKPEVVTGPWLYPAQAKFDRLLRECRVPIGLLTNRREVRLVYAPHGESSGWLSFRVADMATVGGRPILDALVMLLGRERWFGVSAEQQLPALLEQSRRQQADVTTALSGQVFQALEELLAGFAVASERDPQSLLREALERGDGHVYSGLLTLLLRLVFVLYCEDRNLLPLENSLYAKHYSVLGLSEQLERDHGRYPDSMDQRFGAYARLVSLFRAIFLGVQHGDLKLPPRQGALFNPNEYPFLEGWRAGSAPTTDEHARAAISVPSVSDGAVFRVLRQLVYLDGQRLSYRALDVEQIGSVYEALMGFDVERLVSGAVRMRVSSKKGAARVWVEGARVLEVPPARREKWLQDELSFDKGLATKVAAAIKSAQTADEILAAIEPLSGKARERAPAGTLVIQPGPERRRTSSHYTPRSLSEPIVQKTLDPLIRAMGERPSSDALLSLVICDPAVGSGAFLVAACRYLADHVVAAWTREVAQEPGALPLGHTAGGAASIAGSGKTKLQLVADAHEDVVNHARRLVAQRCLYGVDKNRYAVQLARLSLWLVTMAKNEPFTFVDHAIRHGDSLVGLSFDQIRAFHWKTGQKGEQVETTTLALKDALAEAIDLRRHIQELAADSSPEAQQQKARLFDDAQDALGRVRLIADLVIGAFFAHDKDTARQAERDRRLDLVTAWLKATDLGAEESLRAQLVELQQTLRQTQTPFHWMVELPEVFYLERPDPLDRMKVNGAAMVEAFVGNPPFAGKNGISETGGPQYLPWLQALHAGAHGNADLSAHFFRRADTLLGAHGSVGLIATNTIGQGDTRSTALQHLVNQGFEIFAAIPTLPWPGEAAVTVSVVHLAKGRAKLDLRHDFDGRAVSVINSRLRPRPERTDPTTLASNAELSFQGSIVLGMGFTLTPEERSVLIEKDPKNADRIFPYLGGEEVNTSPTQSHDRSVISFGQMSLAEAGAWPDLIEIVREKVKPERDQLKDNSDGLNRKKHWWQFGRWTPALYAAIVPLSRCLVTARVSKHLILSFQPTNRIFSEQLYVFPLACASAFAVLQSRTHEPWARLLSSSLEDRLRYSASDCFETFPFPCEDPRAVLPELEALGEELYNARAAFMVETDQGLTKTYNALKDPACVHERILALRALHERLDAAVLDAYGWSDIAVPPYCVATDADRTALQAFEDEVIDRLFVLNAERAKKEAALGRGKAPRAKAPAAARKAKADGPAPAKRAKKAPSEKAPKESPPSGQSDLGWD